MVGLLIIFLGLKSLLFAFAILDNFLHALN